MSRRLRGEIFLYLATIGTLLTMLCAAGGGGAGAVFFGGCTFWLQAFGTRWTIGGEHEEADTPHT